MKAYLLPACILLGFITVAIAQNEAPKPRGEKITLKLNLPKGEKRTLSSEMEMKRSMTAAGQVFDVSMKMGTTMSVVCLDVDTDGLHTLTLSYDKLRLAMLMGGVPLVDYDSTRAENVPNPVTAAIAALVAGELTLKMKPDGSTTSVEGVDAIAEKAAGNVAGLNIDQLKTQIRAMVKSFEQMGGAYPKVPVDIGDSWISEMEMTTDPNLPMKIKATYTLHNRKDGVAIIKLDGTITSQADLKGSVKGDMHMDEKTGWITGGEMAITLAGKVVDPTAGPVQVDMTSTVKITGK
ncbi:MAG: DUF6263 family protein [Phycisphaeraceae bacterium]